MGEWTVVLEGEGWTLGPEDVTVLYPLRDGVAVTAELVTGLEFEDIPGDAVRVMYSLNGEEMFWIRVDHAHAGDTITLSPGPIMTIE